MDKDKVLIVLAFLLGAILLISVGFNVLVDQVTNRVIQKISKYSPNPYGPGYSIDPDIINTDRPQQRPQKINPPVSKQRNPWD